MFARWSAACWRWIGDRVGLRVAEAQIALLQTALMEAESAHAGREAASRAELARLAALLDGVERITSPDGIVGWYFNGRVGVLTKYFLHQRTGRGAALSCATSWDAFALHAVNEAGAEVAERTAICGQAISPSPLGTNTAVRALAAHAPKGNLAVHAQSGVSLEAPDTLTIVKHERYQ